MAINVDFAELFGGASTPAESLNADTSALSQRQPVALPFDSDLFEFQLPTTSSKAAQQIEDADLIKAICGAEPSESLKAESAGHGLDFVKRAPLSKKQAIDAKLGKLYRHELRERWNEMLDRLASESELDDATLFRRAVAILAA